MTDRSLAATRDHARRMATAEHTDDCVRAYRAACRRAGPKWEVDLDSAGDPVSMTWLGTVPRPDPCPGCVTEVDRALWARLADELDAYLADDDEPDLLSEET